MNLEIFKDLGMARNEALIYETLLQEGESSVEQISNRANVHRRNVYDSLKRLLDKGLVFQIVDNKETRYQPVDPHKLVEILEEKQKALSLIMPQLASLHKKKAQREVAYIYKGVEGCKNYMRDILRIGQNMYTIGGKGIYADPSLKSFLEYFFIESTKKGIKFYVLWDHSVGEYQKVVTRGLHEEHKFLPSTYSSKSMIDVFGDHVVISSKMEIGKLGDDPTLTVIINQEIADSFKTWFKMMWDLCPTRKEKRKKF